MSTRKRLLTKARRRLDHYQHRMNMATRWLSYELGQTRPRIYPHRMYIESTNVCNLRCIMCPTGRHEIERRKGYMDFGLFTRIVDEMAPHVEATTLHIWGEPLLHPRLTDMIAYCREHHLRCEISSNATLLSEDKALGILDAGLDVIYLCLDGVTKETYEAVRRRANFDETQANVRRFLELRNRNGLTRPQVNLQIIQMGKTIPEVTDFVDTWTVDGVDRINVKPFDSWAGQVEEINTLQPAGTNGLPPRYACPNLWYHVHIYWDGSLAMCDRDFNLAYPLGNVNDGVMKAWRGALLAELRRRHVRNDLDGVSPCDSCTEWAWWKPAPFHAQGNRPDDTTALELSAAREKERDPGSVP